MKNKQNFYKYCEDSLQFIPVSKLKTNLLFSLSSIIFIAFLMLGVSSITSSPQVKYNIDTEDILIVDDPNQFSEKKLIQKIKELNLPYPHITLAQAKLESGEYNSRIFKENHNLFGMKEARVRINLAKGTQYGHAYYNSWEESILDYSFWYACYARKCKTEAQLFQLLDNQYAEATTYVSALKRIIKNQNLKSKFK